MKKFITLVLAVAAFTFSANAQKYGHLNAQDVLKQMPEYIAAQAEMERITKSKEAELKSLQEKLQAEYQAYETEAAKGLMSAEIKASREKDILEMQQSIQAFQQKAQEKLQKKEVELLQPMIAKVRDAINAVGKANSFTYIFDSSVGAIVYNGGGNDVTKLVADELTKVVKK